MKLLEKHIEHCILEYLEIRGILAWKNITSGFYDTKKGFYRKNSSRFAIRGVPDIVGIYRALPLFIEVKNKKGVLSDDQKTMMEKLSWNGAIVFVARSVEDVMINLKKVDDRIEQTGGSSRIVFSNT